MPVRRLSKEELETKLAPYKCKMRAAFAPGVELWVTGWTNLSPSVLKTASMTSFSIAESCLDQQDDAARLAEQ